MTVNYKEREPKNVQIVAEFWVKCCKAQCTYAYNIQVNPISLRQDAVYVG